MLSGKCSKYLDIGSERKDKKCIDCYSVQSKQRKKHHMTDKYSRTEISLQHRIDSYFIQVQSKCCKESGKPELKIKKE